MVAGTPPTHGSNQGWGRWEINPAHVVNLDPTEWYQLFSGEAAPGTRKGRYGPNGMPFNPGFPAPGGKKPTLLAQVDYNAARETGTVDRYSFFPAPSLNAFPNFPGGRYGNASTASGELINHARLYDFFQPASDDYALPVGDLYYLLYNGFSGTDYTQAGVYRLLRANLDDTTAVGTTRQGVRRRNMMTPWSMQINQPALEPMFWAFDRTNSDYAIDAANPEGPPSGTASVPPPTATDVRTQVSTAPIVDDLRADLRAMRDVL